MKNNSDDLKSITKVVLNKLASYLEESQQGTDKVLTQNHPEKIAKVLSLEKFIKEGGLNSSSADSFLDHYLANTQHLHHPHYIGHQVAVPHVASGIADSVSCPTFAISPLVQRGFCHGRQLSLNVVDIDAYMSSYNDIRHY